MGKYDIPFLIDPTTAPRPVFQSRDKGALRVNPEQAPASRAESRRVDFSSLSSKMRLTSFYKVMGSLFNLEEVFRPNDQGAFNDFKIYPAGDRKDLDGKEKA